MATVQIKDYQDDNQAKVDDTGHVYVTTGGEAFPVTGTVAVTQDTTPWVVDGEGTPGTPAGGVLSVQGVAGGTPIPISGSITATNPSVGPDGVTAPTFATEVAGIGPTGLLSPLMLDSMGNLLVTSTGSGSPNVNLVSVSGSPITLGQTTMSASLPVTIASDQSPLNVNIVGVNPSQVSVLVYNEVTAVAVGVETTIATYTAPAGPTTSCLLLVYAGGTNVAQWKIYNGSSVYDSKYTSAAELNGNFDFKTGSSIVPGQIIGPGSTIVVTANQIGTSSGTFNARIQVLQIG